MTSGAKGSGGKKADWKGGHARDLGYHRALLDDSVRLDAYDRAIRRLVRPGDVVLDVGTGTGILAMLAARAGAARVHAIESAEVAGLAEQLVAANGLSEVVTIHRADARSLAPVEPVDLVITECMGRFLVDDGMVPAVEAARAWLKPNGRCCPREIVLRLAPVGDLYLGAVDLWRDELLGLDFRPALSLALCSAYSADIDPSWVLAEAADFHRWSLPHAAPPFAGEHRFVCARAGELRALAGWFEATLSDGVTLSTAPGSSTHWGQYLFPIAPQRVEAGDELRFDLRFDEAEAHWLWSGEVVRGGATLGAFEGSTDQRLGSRRAEGTAFDAFDGVVAGSVERGGTAADAANAEGSAAFTAGDYVGAMRAFERAVRASDETVDPRRLADFYENLGLARVQAGRLKAAIRAFARALDGDPEAREQSLRFLIRANLVLGARREAARLSEIYRPRFGALPWESGSEDQE